MKCDLVCEKTRLMCTKCIDSFVSSMQAIQLTNSSVKLMGLRAILLKLWLISDPCLSSSALHEPNCFSHDFTWSVKFSGKADQSAKPGSATVNG